MSEQLNEQALVMKEGSKVLIKDLPRTRSESFLSTYVNNTGLAANFYDLTLVFGNMTVAALGGGPTVEERAAIAMSWEHAKALAAGLKQAVEQYEKDNEVKVRDLPK